MKLSRQSTLTTSILLAGGLALTGCSSSAPAETGGGASQEQPKKQEKQQAPAAQGPITKENFADRMSQAMFAAGSVHASMSMADSAEASIETDMAFAEDPKKSVAKMTMKGMGMDGEFRFVDGTAFMNLGEKTKNKFVDWAEAPAGTLDVDAMFSQMSPVAQATAVAEAIRDVEVDADGPEIDGVKTTQLTVTVDTKTMLAPQMPEGFDIDTLAESLGETMVYDVFLGPDDLPRRFVLPANTGIGTATLDFSAWGEPVSVKAPAANERIDSSTLTQ